ncbi:MAG: lytic transglycosylase domain-containing protein [Gemmatimonadetes bacterium]|nr:lytic transglycosylase domain-containing protein [Acidobacteriota bacterium]MYE16082.1 lytic transglycosylase domain-containing protein [Gemmatimonadota bacterium]
MAFNAATGDLPEQHRINLCGQVRQESAWNPTAVSRAGAAGLAQFMPPTGREEFPAVGCEFDRDKFDPLCSLKAQRSYMDRLVRSSHCTGGRWQQGRWGDNGHSVHGRPDPATGRNPLRVQSPPAESIGFPFLKG